MIWILRRLFTFILLPIALCWLAGLGWFMGKIPMHQTLHADDIKIDAVIVLTGGSKRISHGFELLTNYPGSRLFITGVGEGVKLEDLVSLETLHSQKLINTEQISLDHDATSTITNATEAQKWLIENGHQTAFLVTSNYHMPRSLMEFRHFMPEVTFYPAAVIPDELDTTSKWFSGKMLRLITREYHKYVLAALRIKFNETS